MAFVIRKLKQQRRRRQRRRLRKRHLKSEVVLLQTLSFSFHLVQFLKCWKFVWELDSNRLYRSSGKKSKIVVLCLPTSSTKREISHFLVVVVQWPQRNVQKSVAARAKLLFCQSNLLLFCRSRWRRRRRCLSSLMFDCYPPRYPFFCLTPSVISTQWSIPPKFATFETRRELSRVNFCKDFWARPQ